MSALKTFSKIDNSLRANVLINKPELESLFNEEDMKCTSYSRVINENYIDYYNKNCNVCITIEHSSNLDDQIELIKQSIEYLNPIYFLIINGDNHTHSLIANNYNYKLVSKIAKLNIYNHN